MSSRIWDRVWRWGSMLVRSANVIAELCGGWINFGGILTGAAVWLWGAIKEWGPLSVIVAFYAAAAAMIVLDLAAVYVRRFRSAATAEIAKAARFEELTESGERLLREYNKTIAKRIVQFAIDKWVADVLAELESEPHDEYFGFKSMPFEGQLDKLRRIAMRYSKEHRIIASQVIQMRRGEHDSR